MDKSGDKPRFDGDVVELGSLCSKGSSNLRLKEIKNDGPYPVYGASGIIGYSSKYQNDMSYIAIVKDGAGVGRVNKCLPYSSVLGTMQALIPNEKVSSDYLYHLVRSLRLGEGFTGSTIPHIYFKDYRKTLVRKLTETNQQVVTKNFERIFACICDLESICNIFDSLIKSRFVEMFGDPANNPLQWDTVRLTELGVCKNGLNFKSSDSGVSIPCVSVADFGNHSRIDDIEEISTINLNSLPNEEYYLQDGDILFVRSNGNKELVGRCLAVYPHDNMVVYSGFCIRLRITSNLVKIPFLIWVLKQASIRTKMFGRGANIQNLSQKILESIYVPVPPMSLQEDFLQFVNKVDKLKFAAQEMIDKLQMLYDSLAQDYFSIPEDIK